MTTQRRWLKAAIAASSDTTVSLPWARSVRARPKDSASVPTEAKPQAIAAR